jgi:hypothetical protein
MKQIKKWIAIVCTLIVGTMLVLLAFRIALSYSDYDFAKVGCMPGDFGFVKCKSESLEWLVNFPFLFFFLSPFMVVSFLSESFSLVISWKFFDFHLILMLHVLNFTVLVIGLLSALAWIARRN